MNKLLRVLILLTFAANANAQHSDNNSPNPIETGQSMFAAIAEIVDILRSDPNTEWERVDIDGLRAHLIDMKNVTENAIVVKNRVGMTVIFDIQGDGLTKGSIQRMTKAHAPMLSAESGWNVIIEKTPSGAIMTITAPKEQLHKLYSLGFFGIMTIGAHHQAHHLMIASGEISHAH